MTANRFLTLLIALILLTGCRPAAADPGAISTATLVELPDYSLNVHVTYLSAMGWGVDAAELSITHEEPVPPYPPGIQTDLDVPALTILFRDESGQVLLEHSLPVVFFLDQSAIDGGIRVEWAAVIPNDARYECVVLEAPIQLPNLTVMIEPPLSQCSPQ